MANERPALHVRRLERLELGTRYPAIVELAARIVNDPALAIDGRQPALVVDATGVGRPVIDMLREAGLASLLVPVTISGGQNVTAGGPGWTVPKKDLATGLQAALQSGRLQLAAGIANLPVLVEEMLNFKAKVTPAGNATFEAWREGQHDDLVLALALAVWWAERQWGTTVQLARNPFFDYEDIGPAGGVGF